MFTFTLLMIECKVQKYSLWKSQSYKTITDPNVLNDHLSSNKHLYMVHE